MSSSGGLVRRMALVAVTLALSADLSWDAPSMNLNLALVTNVRLVPEPLPRDNIKPRSQMSTPATK